MKKLTIEIFKEKSTLIHKNFYNYDKVIYKNSITPVEIICPKHGSFLQKPREHIYSASGCGKCKSEITSKLKKFTQDKFIEISKNIHNNFYNYNIVKYIDCRSDVEIICPIHGKFIQNAKVHMLGHGCDLCGHKSASDKLKSNTSEFIKNALLIHNNYYDYSLVEYNNNRDKIKIICSKHGIFKQKPNNHLLMQGCPQCGRTCSKLENSWLDSLRIPHLRRQFKITIITPEGKKKNYVADGFNTLTNTIYEFNGDYWHGNPKIFDHNNINYATHKTFGQLYQKTLQKESHLTQAGYTVITMWEYDWNQLQKSKIQDDCSI